jgi:gamma-glutamyltranspeptidase/glutathione hydrolase
VTAVVDYGKTSFAGGGQLTYYEARTGRTIVINHEPNAVREDIRPYNREREAQTGRSIRVPGSIAGFHLALQKYGARPWKEALEPAIFYAENGFPINDDAYANMKDYYAALTLRPAVRNAFAPNGFLPPVNSLFKQPDMAATLRMLAEQGPDLFYRGALAEEMVRKIQEIGGKATLDDFRAYRAEELEPVWGTYKEYRLAGPPPPATGIVAIIEGFNILEHVDLQSMGHYARSADSLQWVVETLRVMFEDARKYTGVTEFDRALGELLMSKSYARQRYEIIRHKIELSRRAAPQPTQAAAAGVPEDPDLGTNHVAVIDKDGNVCSFTHTIYGSTFSSHALWVGGIVLNDAGGFPAQPGQRIVTPMAPLMVFKGERPYFATGSAGGTLNTFLTALNVLVWNQNLKEAQEAPRISAPGPGEMKVSIENRIDAQAAEELTKRGYTIDWAGPFSKRNAQMAGIDPATSMRYGAADPRGEGHAAGQP